MQCVGFSLPRKMLLALRTLNTGGSVVAVSGRAPMLVTAATYSSHFHPCRPTRNFEVPRVTVLVASVSEEDRPAHGLPISFSLLLELNVASCPWPKPDIVPVSVAFTFARHLRLENCIGGHHGIRGWPFHEASFSILLLSMRSVTSQGRGQHTDRLSPSSEHLWYLVYAVSNRLGVAQILFDLPTDPL